METIENKYIDIVKDILDKNELYDQLAEEAAELAKAALKYKRAAGMSHNVTPVTQEQAKANLKEEIGDVLATLVALGIDIPSTEQIKTNPKWRRWADRLIEGNARRMLQ